MSGYKDHKKKAVVGRQSEIYTVSLHNRPDKASGAGCVRVIVEEAGMCGDLGIAWRFIEPTLRSGKIMKGIGIIFGTGGEMVSKTGKKGSSRAFRDMFYAPRSAKIASYDNIYENRSDKREVGLFFCICWFREGAYFEDENGKIWPAVDKNGNPRFWVAEIDVNKERKIARETDDDDAYEVELTQYCKYPSEAFLMIKGNIFPAAQIQTHIENLMSDRVYEYTTTVGSLVESNGKVYFEPDLNQVLRPINRFPWTGKKNKLEGAVVMHQKPVLIDGKIPDNAYIVCADVIGIESDGGESLSAIYVLRTGLYPIEMGHTGIAASYVGRSMYDPIDNQNRIMYLFAKMYNARVTHENDRSGKEVRSFFLENKAYQYLLPPPGNIIMDHIPNSKTLSRKTGHSMSSNKMKEIGEMYLKRWLLQIISEDNKGNPIRVLDTITDIGFLQELVNYSREGNYDRVLSIMGGVLQLREMLHLEKRNPDKGMKSTFNEMFNKIRQNHGLTSRTA